MLLFENFLSLRPNNVIKKTCIFYLSDDEKITPSFDISF